MGSKLHGQASSTDCQHGQWPPCACDMSDLAFTKINEDYALQYVHRLMVAEIFAGEDNTDNTSYVVHAIIIRKNVPRTRRKKN